MTSICLRRIFGAACFVLALATGSGSALAQNTQRIAATVNDAVISTYDVEQRINLIVFSAGVDRSPETIARIRQQVLRQLIDERLQMQEAERWDVEVSEGEINSAMEDIGARNNMTATELFAFLQSSGVNPLTLMSQVQSDIAWNQLVSGLFSQQVSISEEEIDFVLDRMIRSVNQPEYQVSEIFLSVSNPDEDEQVRQNAERLIEQIRRGANFPAVARQFSENSSAANGGDLGWVQDGQLPDDINVMLRRLTPGQFSLPIRSTGGYYILALRDRRIAGATDPNLISLNLRQIVVPVQESFTEDQIRQAGDTAYRVSESVESCEQMRELALRSPLMVGGDIGVRRLTEIREHFMQALRGIPEGGVTAPIPSEVGFHVLMVCERHGDEVSLPSRQNIEDRLFDQQLSSVARRHLRDLHRDALIDIREGFDG